MDTFGSIKTISDSKIESPLSRFLNLLKYAHIQVDISSNLERLKFLFIKIIHTNDREDTNIALRAIRSLFSETLFKCDLESEESDSFTGIIGDVSNCTSTEISSSDYRNNSQIYDANSEEKPISLVNKMSLCNKNIFVPFDQRMQAYQIINQNRLFFISDEVIFKILVDLLSYSYCQYNVLVILWQISFFRNTHRFFNPLIDKFICLIKEGRESVKVLRVCFYILINLISAQGLDDMCLLDRLRESEIFFLKSENELNNKLTDQKERKKEFISNDNKSSNFFISIVKCNEILNEINQIKDLKNLTILFSVNTHKNDRLPKISSMHDEEYCHALFNLKNLLESKLKRTSSITNYLKELFSGSLEKAPYHFSDSFWCSNTVILSEMKIEIIRALKKYLQNGKMVDQLVAANDIYNLARTIPECIKIIERIGVKDVLIQLSESRNVELRFWVLKSLSVVIYDEILS